MKFFFLFITLFFYQYTHAQWFNNISSFTTQNGLSNNTITCLQKDSDGFLWIGTHEGINRYDGTEFINVLSNSRNNLPSNNITKITFIGKTLMAVGTDAGLCLLNTETFTGKQVPLPFNEKFPTTGAFISDILYKKTTDELWICTWHGLFVLNSAGKINQKIMAADSAIKNGFFARYLLKDAKDAVYFFSQQQAGFYYPNFKSQQLIPAEKYIDGFLLNGLLADKFTLRSALMLDHESTCILSKTTATGSKDYISYYNNATGRHFTDTVGINFSYERRLFNAFPLNDSIFLVNSYFGEPMLYNTNRHMLTMAGDEPLWFTSWPDGLTASVYKDDNNIWIGTSKNLLQSSLKTNFFTANPGLINQLKGNRALVSYNYGTYYNNQFWVSCMGAGLFALDTTHNTVQPFFDINIPTVYSKKIVSTQVFDAGASLWLFSVYGPVQVNPVTKQLGFVDGINKDPSFDDLANYPMKDSKGNIWTSLPDGVAKYNPVTNTFINFKTKYKGGAFPVWRVGPKTEDGQGNIWMARQDTLVKYNPVQQTFSIVLVSKNGKPLRSVTNMASDGDDVLYVNVAGSFGIYNISTGNISLFTKQTGIISTVINDIVSDGAGNAWIATEGGLIFYNKQRKKFSSFTKADGLPDDDVISINFTGPDKKTLFLGFSKTYCLLEPSTFLLDKTVPVNIITSAESDGESFDLHGRPVLPYQQNSISFTYTGINYNQGRQNSYACMLEGFDQAWKYPGAERRVNYINLPPGHYTFKVKSANHQGEWNEQPASFVFVIDPPFWQQWWFLVLVGCILVTAVYGFIKMREANIQKKNNIKLQMSELRMQALRAQMNPHFIFNSLNSIQHYILSNNTIDAAGYLSKFAKLMRRILDQSKHNFLPLGEVMETLQLYVEIESFRFNNEFSYTFNIEDDDELLDMRIPPMLLQPFVENAILHGLMPKQGDKKLIINCRVVKNNAEIIIDDNGIGRGHRTEKAGHSSQGEKLTSGMMESLQQLQNNKASIEIIDKTDNGLPTGTTIKVVLPLN